MIRFLAEPKELTDRTILQPDPLGKTPRWAGSTLWNAK